MSNDAERQAYTRLGWLFGVVCLCRIAESQTVPPEQQFFECETFSPWFTRTCSCQNSSFLNVERSHPGSQEPAPARTAVWGKFRESFGREMAVFDGIAGEAISLNILVCNKIHSLAPPLQKGLAQEVCPESAECGGADGCYEM
jgi:hypothetical protein